MEKGALGKEYSDGEVVIRQGDAGECMYVVQSGSVEVFQSSGDTEIRLATLGSGDVFGEMALFEREVRSATVKAKGKARILSVDKKLFLRKMHEDPSIAFNILQKMSRRIRELGAELSKLKAEKQGGEQ